MTVMAGVACDITCPTCGQPLTHIAAGQPTDRGTRTAAVVECPTCPSRWLLTVTLTPIRRGPCQ